MYAELAQLTLDPVRAALVGRGMADCAAGHFREMYELLQAGESESVTDTVPQVTGRGPQTIEAFLDEILIPDAVSA